MFHSFQICFKGPNVFKGYYKVSVDEGGGRGDSVLMVMVSTQDEEKTKEALDSDGWLHSGDIGRWEPNGTLRIVDRKKHIFKLAQVRHISSPSSLLFHSHALFNLSMHRGVL